MGTAFASEAAHIKRIAGVSPTTIGVATGADPSTVRSWIAGKSSPSGQRAERLTELSAVVERLVLVMKADYVPVWLVKPIAALDDEKPVIAIAEGRYREVSKLIAGLESPGAA
jgi:hypothetical protein